MESTPVVHQVLVDIVGIKQQRLTKRGQQVLRDGLDQLLRMTVLAEPSEKRLK